ncbi:hypothetical protein [Sediminicola luteus]|jgi:hypothetical protein|uniref:Uncharacterized protein n=1 Tax=Sediminicola luteus TaxID=319238 RepID=A0A2A4GAN2_9FLAO|nr:hypothetical protein [Sediminicola luteus]PCE64815.1 hypothetical protein B7P33_06495 [Sediminicola luteus]
MENPFEQVIQNEKLPEVLKEKVMKDVALVKLTLDLADLLMVKYASSVESLLKMLRRSKQ